MHGRIGKEGADLRVCPFHIASVSVSKPECLSNLFHLIYQGSPLQNVFVGDVVLGVRLSVERNAVYVFMLFR